MRAEDDRFDSPQTSVTTSPQQFEAANRTGCVYLTNWQEGLWAQTEKESHTKVNHANIQKTAKGKKDKPAILTRVFMFSVVLAGPDDKIRTVNDRDLLDTHNTSYWTWESRTHMNPDTGLPHYEGGWVLSHLMEVSLDNFVMLTHVSRAIRTLINTTNTKTQSSKLTNEFSQLWFI
jgi:hypothetical protein